MTELLDRLQRSLGHVYRLERELGGGGMSRVFLAEELALRRRIVIKVLPPELGAGLNIDRFRREIELAASLQHPHIVPLLAAGEADGLLYYTMPLVEGESLRARLQREQELPIGGAVRLLRDVVDALACAHEHGVVHRDIKPDNVLVSRQHGLVTDFGVAKALSDATGRSSLTSVGVALGTPAYMAPEQASADPHADHRVDIYAVGVLAYEMLTGRPPFLGNSPQAILAAQVTQVPTPITELRATVPPGVAAMVMRCLEKKPADRWQTADELLHQLEASATPSGGTQPVPAVSVPSGAASSALTFRRWRLPLMALGATVAFGSLVLLGTRRETAAPAPAPVAVADTEEKTLAVLPFKNLGATEDQYFADGLTEEITSRLASVSGLGVISRTSADQYRTTSKSLKEVGRELGAGYVLEGSVRWEKRTGAPSRVRVTPQLIRVADDRHIWADRYDAELAHLFEVQGSIAQAVTAALNVALGAGPPGESGVPTRNTEAYDYYLRGIEYDRRANPTDDLRAAQLLERAVQLDSGFALAWARLAKSHARLYWLAGRNESHISQAERAAERALRLEPTLPDGHLALGLVHYWGRLDYDAALREFDLVLRAQPNNAEAIQSIGYVQRRQGRWKEGLGSLRRAALLDPRSAEILTDIGLTLLVTRDYAGIDTVAAKVRGLQPDLASGYTLQAWRHFLEAGDTAAVGRWTREGMSTTDSLRVLSSGPTILVLSDPRIAAAARSVGLATFGDSGAYYEWRAGVERGMGNRALEAAYWDSARAHFEARVARSPENPEALSGLGRAHAAQGRKPEAIRSARRALELRPMSRDAFDHSLQVWNLAETYAMVGDVEGAVGQLEYLLTIPSWFTRHSYTLWPTLEPIRSQPRFQRFLAELR
jgi:serine/threonine protein kinase/TolB-like protein/Flp pilus assembly protein TadD